jgi:HAMP domain-containing protein
LQMKFRPLLGLILWMLLPTQGHGQNRIQTHLIELQNRIESQINRNVNSLIATQLAPNSFEVAVKVKVVEIPPVPPKPDKKKEIESMPAGMELGSIDVREIIESYKQEIDELKAFKESTKEKQESKFALSRIEVIVGLDESFSNEYVVQFSDWLTKRVRFDYSNQAIATVGRTKALPVKSLPEKGLHWRDFLPILPLFFLALGLVLAALFLARGLRKLGEGSKNFTIEHKTPLQLDQNQNVNQKVNEEIKEETQVADGTDEEQIVEDELKQPPDTENLLGKITFLCYELGARVNELVRVWLDNGGEGFLKTAVLIDTIVTFRERFIAESKVPSTLKIPLDSDLATSYEVNITEAYRQTAQLTPELRAENLNKIYWDLLSMQTLGVKAMRRPFDYLQSMNDFAYTEALKVQSDEARALALMFADPSKTKLVLETSGDEEKAKMIQSMIKMSQVSKKQIWDIDSSVKIQMLNRALSAEDNVVNLLPRMMDILNSLSPVEEIRVLRKIASGLADHGTTLKQKYVTLAFVDEWHTEFVSKLAAIATTSEMVQLIHLIPDVKETVLSASSERMKMIIRDDLKIQRSDEVALAKSIKQLRQKWRQLCANENIVMGDVISFKKKDDHKNAA